MHKSIVLTSIFLLHFIICSAQSENKLTSIATDKPRIEVVGTAEQKVEPDIIYVSIILKEKFKDGTKITVESQEEKFKSELIAIGLNIDRLTLTDANTETIRINKKSKKIITTKTYNLKLSNVADVRKTFAIIDKMEISDATITGTDISNRIEILKNTRIEAIKAAKKKAEYLLDAIGQQLDKPIVIREIEEGGFDYSVANTFMSGRILNKQANTLAESEQNDVTDLTIEKITISAKIYVEYGIK